jgi:hypothetical protein
LLIATFFAWELALWTHSERLAGRTVCNVFKVFLQEGNDEDIMTGLFESTVVPALRRLRRSSKPSKPTFRRRTHPRRRHDGPRARQKQDAGVKALNLCRRRPAFWRTSAADAAFFYSPDRGGEHPLTHLPGWAGVMQAAAFCTLIETRNLNGICPRAWLADVLRRLFGYSASSK